MKMVLHIIVLIFEVLYYSVFMKFTKKEGKFWKYLLLFSLITIVLIFTGTNNLYVYLIFVLLTLYGLKYIVKIDIGLYDMLWIVIMLFVKIIIEFIISMGIYYTINDFLIMTLLIAFIKPIILIILKNKLTVFYTKLKRIWYKNNFYIRYVFSCLSIIYVIITVIMFIVDKW